jgi:hypothetical protein
MPADKIKRIASTPQPRRRATDAVRDSEEPAAGRREVAVVNTTQTAPKGKPSRYADALFLAHAFASKFDVPQQREKRRAEPGEANASYRKSAKRPAKLGRVISKKV